jgi:hypothetical protein
VRKRSGKSCGHICKKQDSTQTLKNAKNAKNGKREKSETVMRGEIENDGCLMLNALMLYEFG